MTIQTKGPGRIDITAGDVIDLDAAEFKTSLKETNNKKLSGRYIVNSVTHDMTNENMFNTYSLSKIGWEDYNDYGPRQSLFDVFNVNVEKLKFKGI